MQIDFVKCESSIVRVQGEDFLQTTIHEQNKILNVICNLRYQLFTWNGSEYRHSNLFCSLKMYAYLFIPRH